MALQQRIYRITDKIFKTERGVYITDRGFFVPSSTTKVPQPPDSDIFEIEIIELEEFDAEDMPLFNRYDKSFNNFVFSSGKNDEQANRDAEPPDIVKESSGAFGDGTLQTAEDKTGVPQGSHPSPRGTTSQTSSSMMNSSNTSTATSSRQICASTLDTDNLTCPTEGNNTLNNLNGSEPSTASTRPKGSTVEESSGCEIRPQRLRSWNKSGIDQKLEVIKQTKQPPQQQQQQQQQLNYKQCKICYKRFGSAAGLDLHLFNLHQQKAEAGQLLLDMGLPKLASKIKANPCICQKCHEVVNSSLQLKRHVALHVAGSRKRSGVSTAVAASVKGRQRCRVERLTYSG